MKYRNQQFVLHFLVRRIDAGLPPQHNRRDQMRQRREQIAWVLVPRDGVYHRQRSRARSMSELLDIVIGGEVAGPEGLA